MLGKKGTKSFKFHLTATQKLTLTSLDRDVEVEGMKL